MLFLNFGDNVLGRYTSRLRISRIINISLFSKIFLKSLGLLSTVLTTSNIAIMRSIFYSKKSWMNTDQKKKKMKLLSRPNLYITNKVRELMKIREYWRKLARRTGDLDAWMKYRSLKRKVKREIRQTERESIADQVKRSCIPKKSTSQRSFSRGDKTVADEFNRFFTSVGHADKINSLVLSMYLQPLKANFCSIENT